jgi:multidrug resistance efflux pump
MTANAEASVQNIGIAGGSLIVLAWLVVVGMAEGVSAKPGSEEQSSSEISVSALEESVVKRLHVSKGDRVIAGEVIAELDGEDAILELRRCRAQVATREAELTRALARRDAAKTTHENLIERDLEVASAESDFAEAQVMFSQLPALLDVAREDAKLASQDARRKTENADALAPIVVLKAETSAKQSETRIDELHERRQRLHEQIEALGRKRDIAVRRRELNVDETLSLAAAEAGVETAKARLEIARADLADAQLSVERMTIRAPADGRVIKISAMAGQFLLKSVNTMEVIRLECAQERTTRPEASRPTVRE